VELSITRVKHTYLLAHASNTKDQILKQKAATKSHESQMQQVGCREEGVAEKVFQTSIKYQFYLQDNLK
ncbi:hypothetical protein THAOC_07888, partial [Thalassiosira oceanica]